MVGVSTTPRTGALSRSISLPQAVALYVSAVLGAGVLVLPGQAASMAGPASLVAWGFACVLGVPLAVMFAHLGRRFPNAGGISIYLQNAFGPFAGGVGGWWYFVAGSMGQTIVPLTGGYYVAEALGAGTGWGYVVAAVILTVAVTANCAGTRVSARAQVALAAGVGAILVLAIIAAIPRMHATQLYPFAPHGLEGIGQAVIVLFFAFAGWEAVAHLAEEFRDSDRDLVRATTAAIVIITVLYVGVAAAVVLTGTYGSPAADRVAVGRLLAGAFGEGAGAAAAVAAVVISLGTTNAFVAAVSRLGYALARDHWLPTPVARTTARGTPIGGVLLVAAVAYTGLGLATVNRWGTEQLVVVPATLVVFVYLAAAAAGIRLLTGVGRYCSIATVVLTLAVLPAALGHLLIPVIVTAVAAGYALATKRRRSEDIGDAGPNASLTQPARNPRPARRSLDQPTTQHQGGPPSH